MKEEKAELRGKERRTLGEPAHQVQQRHGGSHGYQGVQPWKRQKPAAHILNLWHLKLHNVGPGILTGIVSIVVKRGISPGSVPSQKERVSSRKEMWVNLECLQLFQRILE